MTDQQDDYEDYCSTSKHYDTGRQIVGLEEVLGAIALHGQLDKASVLDVGCGTGNYIAALSPYVATVTGVEYNQGMLEQAKVKTSNLSNVTLLQGDATCLPLPSNTYDVVMCTQMIHHLPREGFTALSQFLGEAYRVLKEVGGVLIINTCAPEQSSKCWIGAGLAPNYIAQRYPSIEELSSRVGVAGFTMETIVSHNYQRLIRSKVASNPDGPLNKEWRDLHSAWSCVSEDELRSAQEQWRKRQAEGTLEELRKEREELISSIGETTTVIARKGPHPLSK